MAQYLSKKLIQKFIELEECLTFSKPTELLRVAVIVYSEPQLTTKMNDAKVGPHVIKCSFCYRLDWTSCDFYLTLTRIY